MHPKEILKLFTNCLSFPRYKYNYLNGLMHKFTFLLISTFNVICKIITQQRKSSREKKKTCHSKFFRKLGNYFFFRFLLLNMYKRVHHMNYSKKIFNVTSHLNSVIIKLKLVVKQKRVLEENQSINLKWEFILFLCFTNFPVYVQIIPMHFICIT